MYSQEIRMKNIIVRLSEELKKELQEEASKKGLSLNSYIRMILIERKEYDKR